MDRKEVRWVKIAESIEELRFNENNMTEVDTEERKICIGKFNDEFFAI